MSATEPERGLTPTLQLLPPRSRRQRNLEPEWDVRLGAQRIGHVEQWSVRSSSSIFYRATAFHPDTGQEIPLESSTELDERVAKVLAAWRDPESFVVKNSWE